MGRHYRPADPIDTSFSYSALEASSCPSLTPSLSNTDPLAPSRSLSRRPSLTSPMSWSHGVPSSDSPFDFVTPGTPLPKAESSPTDWVMLETPRARRGIGPDNWATVSNLNNAKFAELFEFDTPPIEANAVYAEFFGYGRDSLPAQPGTYEPHTNNLYHATTTDFHHSLTEPDFGCPLNHAGYDMNHEENNTIEMTNGATPQTIVPSQTFAVPVTPPRPTYSSSPPGLGLLSSQSRLENSIYSIDTSQNTSPHSLLLTPDTPKSSPYQHDYLRRASCYSPLEAKMQIRQPVRGARISKSRSLKEKKRAQHPQDRLVIAKSKKKYRCEEPECQGDETAFERIEHLKRHMKSAKHCRETPFSCCVKTCEEAQKKFGRRDNLKAHYRTHMKAGGGRNASIPCWDPENTRALTAEEQQKFFADNHPNFHRHDPHAAPCHCIEFIADLFKKEKEKKDSDRRTRIQGQRPFSKSLFSTHQTSELHANISSAPCKALKPSELFFCQMHPVKS